METPKEYGWIYYGGVAAISCAVVGAGMVAYGSLDTSYLSTNSCNNNVRYQYPGKNNVFDLTQPQVNAFDGVMNRLTAGPIYPTPKTIEAATAKIDPSLSNKLARISSFTPVIIKMHTKQLDPQQDPRVWIGGNARLTQVAAEANTLFENLNAAVINAYDPNSDSQLTSFRTEYLGQGGQDNGATIIIGKLACR